VRVSSGVCLAGRSRARCGAGPGRTEEPRVCRVLSFEAMHRPSRRTPSALARENGGSCAPEQRTTNDQPNQALFFPLVLLHCCCNMQQCLQQ
jgi:hypothetical protein